MEIIGEEHWLDSEESVSSYLIELGRLSEEELIKVTTLEGGVSNRTYLIQKREKPDWVMKQALEKLKVAVDWYCSPERIEREALGIHWLSHIAPVGTVPNLIFVDKERHLLVMEAVPQPHENWKPCLLRGEVDEDLVIQFGHLLGTIHRVSHERAEEFSIIFAERKYFEDLRLEPYYAYSAAQITEAKNFLASLIQETRAHPLAVVHGDYSPKNVLVHREKLVLLDHEVIHWGDPAFDIGFSCTHFLSKAHHLVDLREKFQKAALLYWKTYNDHVTGDICTYDYEARCVRHTLACMLARVVGRSPLEYLCLEEREHQKSIVIDLMGNPPQAMPEMIRQFVEKL